MLKRHLVLLLLVSSVLMLWRGTADARWTTLDFAMFDDQQMCRDGGRFAVIDPYDAGVTGGRSSEFGSTAGYFGRAIELFVARDSQGILATDMWALPSELTTHDITVHPFPGSDFTIIERTTGNYGIYLVRWTRVQSIGSSVDLRLLYEGGITGGPESRTVTNCFLYHPVDIKPGNQRNAIQRNSPWAPIDVAVLGNELLSANDINLSTIRFGPAHASPLRMRLSDVNSDGLMDLMASFRTVDAGLSCGDTEATITGASVLGATFEGRDSIELRGCPSVPQPFSGRQWSSANTTSPAIQGARVCRDGMSFEIAADESELPFNAAVVDGFPAPFPEESLVASETIALPLGRISFFRATGGIPPFVFSQYASHGVIEIRWSRRLEEGDVVQIFSFENRQVAVVTDCELSRGLDIEPANRKNVIDLSGNRSVSVALLTNETVDATQIDALDARFGRSGTEASPEGWELTDTDRDGDADLVLTFSVGATGIRCGDTKAYLEIAFGGLHQVTRADSITTSGCQ